MKTYHLAINDVDDFIPEFAKALGIEFSEELGEFSLSIPDSLGKGEIRGINFPNGIGLHTYHLTVNQDTELKISHPSIKPIRFIYCLKGQIESSFNDREGAEYVREHQYIIAAPKSEETYNMLLQKDKEVTLCYLEIDRLKFQQYFSFDLHELEPIFYRLFSDTQAQNRIATLGNISLQTSEIIREINNCDITGFPRINFVGAKSLEILSYMLNRFRKEDQEQQQQMREKDLAAIEKTVSYINTNLAQSKTISELAQIAGVNSNKLQEGFQKIYGKTVNEYIRDVRLTRSLQLLSSGKKNVSEVVYELGLSSRSYFSKIFKKKYGVSPRKVISRNE